MTSSAKTRFDANRLDIDQLWAIHEDVAGQGPGRKHGVDVINRAAIVFVTACWESYVEDLAREAFDFLLANVPTATAVPSKVRDLATKSIFDQKDSRKVWDLAENGWRAVLQTHKEEALVRWLGKFNTPKSAQVNFMFQELLGIAQVSSHWHWQRMTVAQAETKLDEYITIRGNIAHRVAHDETVYKNWGEDYLKHVSTLVDKTEGAVHAHLAAVTGIAPW
jgi:hypothetical protein